FWFALKLTTFSCLFHIVATKPILFRNIYSQRILATHDKTLLKFYICNVPILPAPLLIVDTGSQG
ncbi:hypothetical protein, partial [Algivirga pacifica]|uniref:hypothetical protein n=1 Tax=Algivirga pacifica TaxID=1162670 RepID=UPI0031E89FCB